MSPTVGRLRFTRAGLVGTLVVLAVAATCIRLGVWQLERLHERRTRNALIEARMAEPPVRLALVTSDDDDAAYRRVLLAGRCEGEPIVLAGRSRRGAPGIHLLCRFMSDDGRAVLLDRGWLPSSDARTLPAGGQRPAEPPAGDTLEALLVPFPPGEAVTRRTRTRVRIADEGGGVYLAEPEPPVMYRLNREEARSVTGLDLPGWYAQATRGAGTPAGPPWPADPPDLSSGPHLGYAVQWFSFALIALVGWSILARKRGEFAIEPASPSGDGRPVG